jgi:hypothetical protein
LVGKTPWFLETELHVFAYACCRPTMGIATDVEIRFKPTASQPPPQCDGFTRRCKALWMFHKQHALTIWSPGLHLLKAEPLDLKLKMCSVKI